MILVLSFILGITLIVCKKIHLSPYDENGSVINDNWYSYISLFIYQIIGFSIRSNLKDLYFAYVHKFCDYTTIAIVGLLSLNILNVINIVYPFDEMHVVYTSIIAGVSMFMSILYIAENKKQ